MPSEPKTTFKPPLGVDQLSNSADCRCSILCENGASCPALRSILVFTLGSQLPRKDKNHIYWTSTFLIVFIFFIMSFYHKCSIGLTFLLAGLLAMHLVLVHNEMGSKPGATGHVIFLVAMLLPFYFRFNTYSVIASCTLLTAATFTKELNIIGFPVLLSYVFIYKSRYLAFKAGIFSVLFYFSCLIFYEFRFPNSYCTLFPVGSQFEKSSSFFSNSVLQKLLCLLSFYPTIIATLGLLLLAHLLTSKLMKNKSEEPPHCTPSTSSMLANKRIIPYPVFCAGASIAIYFLIIAPKTYSNHYYYNYIYLFFLLYSFLYMHKVVATKISASQRFSFRKKKSLLLCLMVVSYFAGGIQYYNIGLRSRFYFRYIRVTADHTSDWNVLREVMLPYGKILGFRFVTPIILEQNKPHTESGQPEDLYFHTTPRIRPIFIEAAKRELARQRDYVRKNKYDALFLWKLTRNDDFPVYVANGHQYTEAELGQYGYKMFYDEFLQGTLYGYQIAGFHRIPDE